MWSFIKNTATTTYEKRHLSIKYCTRDAFRALPAGSPLCIKIIVLFEPVKIHGIGLGAELG